MKDKDNYLAPLLKGQVNAKSDGEYRSDSTQWLLTIFFPYIDQRKKVKVEREVEGRILRQQANKCFCFFIFANLKPAAVSFHMYFAASFIVLPKYAGPDRFSDSNIS